MNQPPNDPPQMQPQQPQQYQQQQQQYQQQPQQQQQYQQPQQQYQQHQQPQQQQYQQPHNPYQAPQHQQPYPPQPYQQYGMQQQGTHPPCPKCGHTFAKDATFTWWGGVLGPKLFSHVNCLQCQAGYNGKTGQSNNTKIAVYIVVLSVVSIGLMIALGSM